jgi:hypothetical protein
MPAFVSAPEHDFGRIPRPACLSVLIQSLKAACIYTPLFETSLRHSLYIDDLSEKQSGYKEDELNRTNDGFYDSGPPDPVAFFS